MITENLSTLKINKLTQEQYDRELAAGRIDENALYLTPDDGISVDDTLTITGAAADAKATGDHLNTLAQRKNYGKFVIQNYDEMYTIYEASSYGSPFGFIAADTHIRFDKVSDASIEVSVNYPLASITKEGLMSSDDKINLNSVVSSLPNKADKTHTHDYLALSGGTLTGDLKGTNEFLSGSLYVGDKTSTSDGKTGVAFGANGNITMQGSSTPTINFIDGTNTSAVNRIIGKANELIVYGDVTLSMYTVTTENAIYGVNITKPASGNGYLRPNGTAAGDIALGNESRRFSSAYLVNAANVTSDRNAKTDIHDIDERFIKLFDKLEPVSYKLIGENHDRNHLGFISQDIKATMDEIGISDMEFGGYCRDIKLDPETDEPILDENGNLVYAYSLRYGEFIALNTKMIQENRKTIKEQQKTIEKLEKDIAELKSIVATLSNK